MSSVLSASGRLGSNVGNDWYSLVVTGTQTVDLDVSALYGEAVLKLYASTSTTSPVATASSTGAAAGADDGWVNEVLSPGTYYLDITSLADTTYSLKASTGTPAVGALTVDNAGNTIAAARNIGTLAATQTFADAIGGTDVADFYAFNVAGPSNVAITLGGLSSAVTVSLLNAAGNQIAYANGSSTSDASLITTLGSLSAGTYYIDITGNPSATTGYSMTVAATAITPLAGTTIGTPRTIGALTPATQSFTDDVNPVTTQEFYSFTVGAVSRLDAVVSGLTAPIQFTLFDGSGTQIATTSGGLNGLATLLPDLPANAAGTHYTLEIAEQPATSTSYTLSLNATPIANGAGTSEAAATSLTLSSAPVTVNDFVGVVDPADWYSFVLTGTTTLNADLSVYSGDNASAAMLSLYALSGSSTSAMASANADGSYDGVFNKVLAPGTYYAEVSTAISGAVDAPYTLSLSTGAASVGTPAVQNAGSTLATARNIGTPTAAGTSYADALGPGDANDYYEITLPTAAIVRFDLSGITTTGTLALLDLTGKQIQGQSSNPSGGTALTDEVVAGSYILDVSNAGTATGYSLFAASTPIADNAGSTLATARNIGSLSTTQVFSDFVGPVDNEDIYEFTLTAAAAVALDVTSRSSGVSLVLRDVSGNTLAGAGQTSLVDASLIQPLNAGTYYADISNASVAADYTFTIGATPIVDAAGSTIATADLLGTFAGAGTVAGGSPTVDAGSGSGAFTVPAGSQYVTTEGNNVITASTGTPTVAASTGNPLVYGNASSLTFAGGSGAATVIGGSAGNTITGGSGSLVLFAVSATTYTPGSGSATIVGGAGGLTASLGAGGGAIFGGTGGLNLLTASGGVSALVGAGAGDVLTARNAGNDILVAAAGAETLNASQSSGNDVFFGGSGADCISGGAGSDFFLAGTGNETLSGGAGFNAYVFISGTTARTDIITDFDATRNVFELFGYAANAKATVLANATVTGGNTSLSLGDGTSIVLNGVTNLGAANFL